MYYHGAKSHQAEAMKWITRIVFFVSSVPFLTLSGAVANDKLQVTTFAVKTGGRQGRGGASVVYACSAGNVSGPCVDEPSLCTSQGGKFVGYCFFDGKYEGVCCPGLNPANATLTTKPPHQVIHDETTTAPPQTFPTPPTMTTQTFPPATSDTLPPAPTNTMPPAPTNTMPPAPTNTMPPAPTNTMPPAPTMTSDTLPPAPTMTTQTMPPAPTMTSDTLPPAPTTQTQTMPPAPTMTTQTPPTPPTMTTQTPPTPPTMTTQTPPTPPTMTTQTLPPAPSFPTQSPPPPPSPPGLHDETTTAAPTPPTPPSMPTQTVPTAPTMTTQTLPPNPTMTTQTMPPNPTMTTQTMPPNPTMTTQTMPPNPTMTTQTTPTAPNVPTTPQTPAQPTAPTLPPTPAPPSTPSSPPPPSTPSETTPTAPNVPTTPQTPAQPTAPTLPPTPAPPSTPSSPPPPSPPSETTPTAPNVPTTPQTPAPPTAPTLPQTPAPPSPSTPPAHFDNSSTTHHTFFPTLSTRTPFPEGNFTMTTQSLNFTTQSLNFTTHSWNMTTESHNFTTQQMNITYDMTLTTRPMPNITGPTFPTTEAESEATTQASTEASTQPSFDLPQDGAGCGVVTSDIQSIFQNPSYPSLDTEPNVYEYSVIPRDDFCALRVEFIESHLAGKGMEGCSIDSVVIINSMDTPTAPQCGLLQGYQFTVRQQPGQPVKIVVTTQSSAHLWNINVTQIQCSSIRPYQDYESPDCGVKNPKEAPPGISIHQSMKEEPKSIAPTRLLKSRRKTLRDITSDPSLAPSKLLQSAVLNRETNIKIVRGNETTINEYPWQALLMVNGKPLCGASIINENWVVTAGHCVQLNLRYPLISVLTVDLGDHDLRTTKETKNIVYRISKVIPNAQNEGVRNDIALIKLATKIPFSKTIRPVCFPQPKIPSDTYAGRTGITTGWGRTEDSVISPVLREATLPILSNEKCRLQWSSVAEGAGSIIDSGMICAGGGDVGPCNGDSGGPLVLEDEDKHRLVGLTSFGLLRGCAISGVPSVFTRVTEYLDWIALNLADA